MTRTAKATGEGTKWRGLGGLPTVAACLWLGAIPITAFLVDEFAENLPNFWPLSIMHAPEENDLGTVVEVVPAIVIAIFIFAVGTLFVVAQVVPPARGTRAVELLRGQHLSWTISPALALTPLSTLLLVLDEAYSRPLASALLIGSVVYLLGSSWFLLSILGEATDPVHYSKLLGGRHDLALQRLRSLRRTRPPAFGEGVTDRVLLGAARISASTVGRVRFITRQRAVDAQYNVIRALRGWMRTAAISGDSRELHVALETTLSLVKNYAEVASSQRQDMVPRNYEHNAKGWHINPLDGEEPLAPGGSGNSVQSDDRLDHWKFWVPPAWPGKHHPPSEAEKALSTIWVANEVGRSLVRAVEFASTSKNLLDRDRGRLLGSLGKAARRFGEKDVGDAGVMMAYLIELGLGVRQSPPEELLWHFEPLVSLARLHQRFDDPTRQDARGTEPPPTRNYVLAVGSAAGVLKVAEAITAVRIRQYYEQKTMFAWGGQIDWNTDQDQMVTICARTVGELCRVPGMSDFRLSARLAMEAAQMPGTAVGLGKLRDRARETIAAAKLAHSDLLEPRDQVGLYVTDPALVYHLRRLLR